MLSRDVVVDQVIQRQGSAPPFVHSVRVRSPLTMRYWDYLAWAIEQARPRRVLLLGLGGGTVLQLLERRGVMPSCVAIDLDAQFTALLRERGWLTYPRLTVLHEDARLFLTRQAPTELFDAIVVDVYDERGYVQELYDQPLLHRLVANLAPDGVLLMHCLDPMAKFPSFRMLMPQRPASPSCSVGRHLASLGMTVAAYPMWSTALIASSRNPYALDWSTVRDLAGGDTALAWSRQFYASRRMSEAELSLFLKPLDGDYSYANLGQLDGGCLASLAAAAPAPLRTALRQALRLPESDAEPQPGAVRELVRHEERELTATTLRVAMALQALLERTTPGSPDCGPFVQIICEALRADSNVALSHVESFAVAWSGDFARALAILHENGAK